MTQPNLIDRVIGYLSPRLAAERSHYRDVVLPAMRASYSGGSPNRLDRFYESGNQNYYGLRPDQRQRFMSMRDRAQQLDNDNALASSLLDRSGENVIGVGIRMKARTKSKTFNEQADANWTHFWRHCDVRGTYSFGAIQRMMYRAYERDGDAGMIRMYDAQSGMPRLQMVESGSIRTPDKLLGREEMIKDGVEINAFGRPVAFHILTEDGIGKREFTRIPAERFVFLANLKRPYQVRGLTKFAQGFTLFDQVWGYIEATVVAARVGASQAMLIKRDNATAALAGLDTAANSQGNQQRLQAIEPGMIQYLRPGESSEGFTPTQPTQSFPDAVAALARFTGLNFGITLEQVMLDFSRTNYSSARAARLQAEQTAYCEQEYVYQTMLCPTWEWVTNAGIVNGTITEAAPDDYLVHEWIPQGRPWVDPTKEIDAAIREVKELGTNARSNIAVSQGYNFADIVEQNRKDEEMLKGAGLDNLMIAAAPPQTGKPNNGNQQTQPATP